MFDIAENKVSAFFSKHKAFICLMVLPISTVVSFYAMFLFVFFADELAAVSFISADFVMAITFVLCFQFAFSLSGLSILLMKLVFDKDFEFL